MIRGSAGVIAKSFSTLSGSTKDFFRKAMRNADEHLINQLKKASDIPLEEMDFAEHNRMRRLGDRVSNRLDTAYGAEIKITKLNIKDLNGKDEWAIPVNIDGRNLALVGSIYKDSDEYVNEIYSAWLFDESNNIVARCAMNKGEGREKSHHILLFHCDEAVTLDNNKDLVFSLLLNHILDKVTELGDEKALEIRTSCINSNIDRRIIDRITGQISYDLGSRAMVSLTSLQRKLKDFLKVAEDRVYIAGDDLIGCGVISPKTAKMLKDRSEEPILE